MIGRNDSEWGHIGAMTIAGTLGWTIEAPADAAYAVLPVGVDIISPTTSEQVFGYITSLFGLKNIKTKSLTALNPVLTWVNCHQKRMFGKNLVINSVLV